MLMKVLALVASLLVWVSVLLAQEPKTREAPMVFPSGYLDHDALTAALEKVASQHPDRVRVRSLTKTLQGRDVWLVTLGRAGTPTEPKPAVLVVANLEADHVVGSQVALGLVERLAREIDLDGPTVYVVPRLNPDGAERSFRRPLADFRTNLRAMDRDRDGRSNEDGPEDLDGDGLVTRMRVKDGKATLVADEKDPRLARPADAAKGERAAFSEYSEGVDNDGDGRINEDPPGGVNLNRNWPHRWTEFDPEAGYSPASEPAVHALIQFAFDHPEIAAVWTFSLQDNLRAEPKKPGSTLDDADLPYLAELSRLFARAAGKKPDAAKGAAKKDEQDEKEEARKEEPKEEAKKEEPAKKAAPAGPPRGGRGRRSPAAPAEAPRGPAAGASTSDGSMAEWAYHQYGVVALASRLWDAADLPDPTPAADGEARWLSWNDHVMGGKAFVPFRPFEHPALGKVEIGGWRPGVRLNPPAAQVGAITDSHAAFLKTLLTKLPRLEADEVKVEAKGGGLFAITAVVANTGYLPTALAQGVRTRKAAPVIIRLHLGGTQLLAGRALERVDALGGSGGRREFRWLVHAPEAVRSITLDVSCPKAGRVVRTIELRREGPARKGAT
jgi:hypothetical protein